MNNIKCHITYYYFNDKNDKQLKASSIMISTDENFDLNDMKTLIQSKFDNIIIHDFHFVTKIRSNLSLVKLEVDWEKSKLLTFEQIKMKLKLN